VRSGRAKLILRKVTDKASFHEVFQRLRSILARYVPPLVVTTDTDSDYVVAVDFPSASAPARYFGGVNIRRRYVSFYLMPVYGVPALLIGASDELLKRMQGKSCFNFTKVDEVLFEELAGLADRGVPVYLERLPEIFARKLR
jgi:hypothetical protein